MAPQAPNELRSAGPAMRDLLEADPEAHLPPVLGS
jgi:hypothetical protein